MWVGALRSRLTGWAITDDPLETTRNLLDRKATVRHGFLDVLGESVTG